MSALKKVVSSTSRDIEHVSITYKMRTIYTLECGHDVRRETDRHVTPSTRLKCETCAKAGPS